MGAVVVNYSQRLTVYGRLQMGTLRTAGEVQFADAVAYSVSDWFKLPEKTVKTPFKVTIKKLVARIIVSFLLLRSFCSQAVLVGWTIQSRHFITAGPEVHHQLTPMMINMVE